MLISESPYKKILLQNSILLHLIYHIRSKYTIQDIQTAHGDNAITIKNSTWHHELDN